GVREGRPAALGEREPPRRAAAAAVRLGDVPLLHPPAAEQGVEVPPDGGRGDREPLGQLGRGLRAVLEQQGRHAVTRATVVRCRFHNTSVTYFRRTATGGGVRSAGHAVAVAGGPLRRGRAL